MKKIKVNEITEGAMYIALYGILALLTRYIFVSFDSIIYYFYPIPIALYTIRQKWGISLACALGSILVSFIFCNPLYAVGLIGPNILAGYVFGLFEKNSKLKVVNYLITYALLLASDFLSIYLFTDGTYFQETLDILTSIANAISSIDQSILTKIATICETLVLVIDSLVKEIILILLFIILVSRLKLVEGYNKKVAIKLVYSPVISLIYVVLLFVQTISTYKMVYSSEIIYEILFTIVFVIMFILSLYVIYQTLIMVRIETKKLGFTGYVIISLILLILFPITIFIGIILNLFKYNFILRELK